MVMIPRSARPSTSSLRMVRLVISISSTSMPGRTRAKAARAWGSGWPASTDMVAASRTRPSPPPATARRSSASRSPKANIARAWRASTTPSGVGVTPRAARSSSRTPSSASSSWMRLAAAETAMPQRPAARVTLPQSIAANRICRLRQSGGRVMPARRHRLRDHRLQAHHRPRSHPPGPGRRRPGR